MRLLPLICLSCSIVFSISSYGASNYLSPPVNQSADEIDDEWAQIEVEFSGNLRGDVFDKDKNDPTERKTARGNRARDISEKAANFYTKHPEHPKAQAAKKVQVLSLLQAVAAGEVEHEPKAERLAAAFRNDVAQADKDRFEVAVAMRRHELAKGKLPSLTTAAEMESMGDSLIAEFPAAADAHRFYIGALRLGDEPTIRRVATKVEISNAPEEVKAEARRFLARVDLIGKRVDWEIPTVDGSVAQTSKFKSGLLIYVWTAQSDGVDALFEAIQQNTPAGFTNIGVNIDQDTEAAKRTALDKKAPGLQYIDARGLKSPAAVQLVVIDVPSVYIIDRKGVLAAFGSPYDLPALVAKVK